MIGNGDAIARVHRPDHRGCRRRAPARDSAVLLERLRQDRPDADRHRRRRRRLLRRARPQGAATTSTPSRCARYFPTSRRSARACSTSPGGSSGSSWTPVGARTPARGTTTSRPTTCRSATASASAGSTSTCTRARASTSTPRSSTSSTGVAGTQLAEGVLVCNFTRGLMEHDDVVTLFHEFGHLVHHVLAGRAEWVRFSGVATEWDFVEAPSQMLEEWAWDADVLAHLRAQRRRRGRSRPTSSSGCGAADDFGKGYDARTQMFYAALSYDFHVAGDRRPHRPAARAAGRATPSFPYLPGTHMQRQLRAPRRLLARPTTPTCGRWSSPRTCSRPSTATTCSTPRSPARYRDKVLAQGGRRDAADLVEDFLGRPYTFDAYAAWLAE